MKELGQHHPPSRRVDTRLLSGLHVSPCAHCLPFFYPIGMACGLAMHQSNCNNHTHCSENIIHQSQHRKRSRLNKYHNMIKDISLNLRATRHLWRILHATLSASLPLGRKCMNTLHTGILMHRIHEFK